MSDVNPWETPSGSKIWKNKSQFMNYVRGGIRKGLWMRHPLKVQFIKDNRIRVPLGRKTLTNPKGLVWGAKCESCGEVFKSGDVQVDHIKGNNKLNSKEDLQHFIEAMIFIDPDEDLQIVCKPCHKAKTYSENRGISMEDAIIEKRVIEIMKGCDKKWLENKGQIPESNAKGRRDQIRELIKEENL